MLAVFLPAAPAQYPGWKQSGSIWLLTTPEGAGIPAGAVIEGFPLLVRLHKDFFDFSQGKVNGDDVRFSSSAGEPLAYQIEEWDAARGEASVWVRLPKITGNARQELRVFWGKGGREERIEWEGCIWRVEWLCERVASRRCGGG